MLQLWHEWSDNGKYVNVDISACFSVISSLNIDVEEGDINPDLAPVLVGKESVYDVIILIRFNIEKINSCTSYSL